MRNADPVDVSVAYMNLGNVYSGMAQYDLGIQYYLKASSLLPDEPTYEIDRAYLNYNLANNLVDFEDLKNASKYLQIALGFATKHEMEDLYASIYNMQGEIALRKGKFEEALFLADSSLQLSRDVSDLIEEIYALELIARSSLRLGEPAKAVRLQKESLRKSRIYGDPYLVSTALSEMADIYRRVDSLNKAFPLARQAYQMRDEQNSIIAKKRAAEVYAKVLDQKGLFREEAAVMAEYIAYQDSLHRVNINESILEAQNETYAQNNALLKEQASLQQTLIERNNLIRIILIITLLSALVLLGFIGYFNRKKNLANRELLRNQSLLDEKSKALEQLNQQLENLNQGKDKLLSILTHDIKQPFNQTLGVLELLDVYTEDNEELSTVLRQVRHSVENDRKTVENLLLWSKSQFARISANPEEVDCHELTGKVMNELKTSILDKELKLDLAIDENCQLVADPYHLEIILRNLITNAVKFSHKGGKLAISSRKQNNKVEIAIKDEGVGMSETEITSLFDQNRHFSKNGTLNEAGTGLGMLVVYDFVKENQGEIEVESEPEKGSVFKLRFPAA